MLIRDVIKTEVELGTLYPGAVREQKDSEVVVDSGKVTLF